MRTNTTIGAAEDRCSLAGDGQELEIGFNVRYLAEALRVIPTEEVTLELTNGLSPIVLTPVDEKEDFALSLIHILYAIANGIRKENPNANIVYIKGDQFTNELIAAIQNGKNIEFRSKYREADLFLIDDVQFIAGRPESS